MSKGYYGFPSKAALEKAAETSDWLCSQCGEWHSDHKKAEATSEPSEAAMREAEAVVLDGIRNGQTIKKVALALDRHAAVQREALQAIIQWAEAQCPCSNEQPDPCPLCGASVNGCGPDAVCRAADYTLPKHLLDNIAAAIRSEP